MKQGTNKSTSHLTEYEQEDMKNKKKTKTI